jgi:hypothetical protein
MAAVLSIALVPVRSIRRVCRSCNRKFVLVATAVNVALLLVRRTQPGALFHRICSCSRNVFASSLAAPDDDAVAVDSRCWDEQYAGNFSHH